MLKQTGKLKYLISWLQATQVTEDLFVEGLYLISFPWLLISIHMDFAFVSMPILKHTGSLIRKYKSTWVFYIWKYDIFN